MENQVREGEGVGWRQSWAFVMWEVGSIYVVCGISRALNDQKMKKPVPVRCRDRRPRSSVIVNVRDGRASPRKKRRAARSRDPGRASSPPRNATSQRGESAARASATDSRAPEAAAASRPRPRCDSTTRSSRPPIDRRFSIRGRLGGGARGRRARRAPPYAGRRQSRHSSRLDAKSSSSFTPLRWPEPRQ